MVENWFEKVKKYVLPKKRHCCRPGEFIRKQYVAITGRVYEAEMYSPGLELESWSKRRKQEKDTHEKWQKKTKVRKKVLPIYTVAKAKHKKARSFTPEQPEEKI